MSRWEAGQRPRRYILDALARELGCRVSDLFDADNEADAPLSRDERAQFLSLLDKLGVRAA